MKSKYHYPTRNRYKKAFNDVFSYNIQCKQTQRKQKIACVYEHNTLI